VKGVALGAAKASAFLLGGIAAIIVANILISVLLRDPLLVLKVLVGFGLTYAMAYVMFWALMRATGDWEEKLTTEQVQRRYDEWSYLACEGKPLRVEVRALPRNRQTIYLRFKDFKAKVCKPFAL